MGHSSHVRAVLRQLALLLLSVPTALLVFTPVALAGTVPLPSPGPPNIPLDASGSTFVNVFGALFVACVLAASALAIRVETRREANLTGDRVKGGLAALPAKGRADEEKRRLRKLAA
jgi:hypothetical protein